MQVPGEGSLRPVTGRRTGPTRASGTASWCRILRRREGPETGSKSSLLLTPGNAGVGQRGSGTQMLCLEVSWGWRLAAGSPLTHGAGREPFPATQVPPGVDPGEQ